jgi:hypothetical protein
MASELGIRDAQRNRHRRGFLQSGAAQPAIVACARSHLLGILSFIGKLAMNHPALRSPQRLTDLR